MNHPDDEELDDYITAVDKLPSVKPIPTSAIKVVGNPYETFARGLPKDFDK